MSKHSNISVFVAHLGCPQQCSFCNQHYIAGTEALPQAEDISNAVKTAVNSKNYDPKTTELAFFGGSFTAIDRDYMLTLLEAAHQFVKSGEICGIRISTRPDAIDDEILGTLKRCGVTAIELGAQSMNDEVLNVNRRGHNAQAVRNAAALIKEYGFKLGLQMMTGLYKDTPGKCVETAREFIKLGADCVRFYPTVIIKGTYLGELFEKGMYQSFSFDETIDLCAELLEMFDRACIPVIRLGLHSGGDFDGSILGGVYHPALREITEGRMTFNKMKEFMERSGEKRFRVYTDRRNISRVSGHKKENKIKLGNLGYSFVITQEDGTDLRIEAVR